MQPAAPLRIVPILPNRSVERVESLEVSVILHIFGSTSNSATMKHTKRSTRETCSLYASLKYRWARIKRRYYICMKEPVALTRLLYRMTFGHDPDLERPQTYNEKVLWLKLFTDTSLWTLLADKYRVREYVRQRIGRGGKACSTSCTPSGIPLRKSTSTRCGTATENARHPSCSRPTTAAATC